MKQSINAEIILDSIETIDNNRITTWKLTFPRFILAEMNTHRILTKNSASSRAIPFKKMVKLVLEDPFIPIRWMKEHPGMQGNDYLDPDQEYNLVEFIPLLSKYFDKKEDNELIELYTEVLKSYSEKRYKLVDWWLFARDKAVEAAVILSVMGLTKQICNRLLEPFMWHTILLTGTEFENFFALRAHHMAEIHLQDLAFKMLEAYNLSTPNVLEEGEWHIPFSDEIDESKFAFLTNEELHDTSPADYITLITNYKIKISTAKCAQISYLKFGADDYGDLVDLHDSLFVRPYQGKRGVREIIDPIHASPAEHIAQAMIRHEYNLYIKGKMYWNEDEPPEPSRSAKGWCHNLRGFKSYRSMLPNENSRDKRIIKKEAKF